MSPNAYQYCKNVFNCNSNKRINWTNINAEVLTMYSVELLF